MVKQVSLHAFFIILHAVALTQGDRVIIDVQTDFHRQLYGFMSDAILIPNDVEDPATYIR